MPPSSNASLYRTVVSNRAYPREAQFNIDPELRQQLENVDTTDITDFKETLGNIGGRVVTSVSMGYLAMLELSMSFKSSEDILAFKAALAANPTAFAFLTGTCNNGSNDTTTGSTSSSAGQAQDNNDRRSSTFRASNRDTCQDLRSLTHLAVHIQKSNIQMAIGGRIVQRGQLRDGEPVPDARANFGLAFGDISSLIALRNAYHTWRDQNLNKEIINPAVVMVGSSPISIFSCYNAAIDRFTHEGQALSLQSANTLLGRKINQRIGILRQFATMIQSSRKAQKEANIMSLMDQHPNLFQSCINDRTVVDARGNQLIHYASFFDLSGLITRLVTMGADINSTNEQGMTPLMIVARNGYIESFEAVLAANPNLELADNGGWTALTHASATSYNGLKQIGGAVAIAALAPIAPLPPFLGIAGGITLNVSLPDYQCKHIFYCNHSQIKRRLMEVGANEAKTCSTARNVINTAANALCMPEQKLGDGIRYFLKGDCDRLK